MCVCVCVCVCACACACVCAYAQMAVDENPYICIVVVPTCPGCSHGVWYSARWHRSLTRWYLGRKFSSWATSFPSPILCIGFLSVITDKQMKIIVFN